MRDHPETGTAWAALADADPDVYDTQLKRVAKAIETVLTAYRVGNVQVLHVSAYLYACARRNHRCECGTPGCRWEDAELIVRSIERQL